MTLAARLQPILREVLGWVYGPLRSRWDPERGAIACRANWHELARVPTRKWRRATGRRRRADWPQGAAACSTLAWLVLASLWGDGPDYDPRGGRSVSRQLRPGGPRADRVLAPGPRTWWRTYDWGHLSSPSLPSPVCVACYRGHVVLAIDCETLGGPLYHPGSGERCRGVWVLAADGSFRDAEREGGGVRRSYSCLPLRWEPASARWARERERPDRRRLFALVPIRVGAGAGSAIVTG